MMRTAEVTRQTRETDISLSLNLDGSGQVKVHTGVGFFDHMLTALFVHGGFDPRFLPKAVKGFACFSFQFLGNQFF